MKDDVTRRLANLKQAFASGALDEDTYRAAVAGLTSAVDYKAVVTGPGAAAQDDSVAAGAGGIAIGSIGGSYYGSSPGARAAQQPVPSYTPEDPRTSLVQQLAQHRRTLQHLEEQKSQFSSGYVPAHLFNQIESEQQEIDRLEQALAELE
jgi:hypothetical protein